MSNKISKKTVSYKWVPFILILSYTLITLFISFWGPLKYLDYNRILVFTYAVAFLFFTYVGMVLGLNSKTNISNGKKNKRRLTFRREIAILTYVVFIIKGSLLINSIITYGMPDVLNIFSLMAKTYTDKSLGLFADRNIIRQIDTFTTFIYIISVCGVLYDWKESKKRIRVIMIVNIILTLIYTVVYIGDQKPFMDIMIYIISAILVIKVIEGKRIFSYTNIVKTAFLAVCTILFFSTIITSRLILWDNKQSVYLNSFITLNLEHPFLAWLPDSLKYQIGFFLIYPTMGWYGLSLTLQLPFQWSYFLGSARGFNSILNQFISFVPSVPEVYRLTYLGRMELRFGYDGLANWHTIFPWLASDFTFIGALILMGIVAYIYSKSWREAVEYNNPISFMMFSQLNIMYIFLVANNQLFIQRGSTVATIIILGFWIFKHKYYNLKVDK